MAIRTRHDMAALIDRQVQRYALTGPHDALTVPACETRHPFVAISRAAAIDALPVVRAIGARTGYPVLDQELVEEIARRADVPRTVVSTYDLNPHAELEQMIADLPFMHLFSEDEYVRHLGHAVRDLAARGSAILVGHAAGMFLPRACGVRVHLTAPLDVRARWVSIAQGVGPDEARRQLATEDDRQRVFCERHFGFAQDAATDLTLDLARLGEGAIADQVAQLLAERLIRIAPPARAAARDLVHGAPLAARGGLRIGL